MNSMYECTTLETFKKNLHMDSVKRVAAYYEPAALRDFLSSASARVKEKIFSISNPSIFFEILNPLIELNSLYDPSKLPGTPTSMYKLDQIVDGKRIATVSVQSLNMLSDIVEAPEFKSLLSEFIFLEKKILPLSAGLTNNQKILDAKNIIAEPTKIFKTCDKILKVQEQSYLKIFEGYQKLLGNFARGFKFTCRKEHEDNFFFHVAHYYLHTFPHEITIEEVLLNRVYASLLSFGYILENRILRAFEKNKILIKTKNNSQKTNQKTEIKEAEPKSKIHIGNLCFMAVENTFEMNEYEEIYNEQAALTQRRTQELIDDLEEIEEISKDADKKHQNLQVKRGLKLSDTSSVKSASTSESSADSETLRTKRKHRKRSKKNKKRGPLHLTPEEYLSNYNAWNFQNWVCGYIPSK